MRKSVIEQLENIPMHEVLKKYHLPYVEGRNMRCPFPAHGATGATPSFRVYDDRTFACFGCRAGGNPIHFIMHMEGLDYVAAADKLMEMFGMEKLPEFSYQKLVDKAQKKEETRDQQVKFGALGDLLGQIDPNDKSMLRKFSFLYAQINNLSMEQFLTESVECLTSPVEQFVQSVPQNIKDNQALCIKIIKSFIRHAFESDRAFDPNWCLSGYYSDTTSGLSWPSENGRYVFPIFLPGQIVAGFSGRALGDEFVKYQTELLFGLSKKDLMFGLDHAFPYIKSSGQVIVVEGILDAVRCWSLGFHNTVAPCCAYLSHNLLFLLKSVTHKFILLQDNDYGGDEEAKMSMKFLEKNKLDYLRVHVPSGEDPDSYGKWHPNEMIELLKQASS